MPCDIYFSVDFLMTSEARVNLFGVILKFWLSSKLNLNTYSDSNFCLILSSIYITALNNQ